MKKKCDASVFASVVRRGRRNCRRCGCRGLRRSRWRHAVAIRNESPPELRGGAPTDYLVLRIVVRKQVFGAVQQGADAQLRQLSGKHELESMDPPVLFLTASAEQLIT